MKSLFAIIAFSILCSFLNISPTKASSNDEVKTFTCLDLYKREIVRKHGKDGKRIVRTVAITAAVGAAVTAGVLLNPPAAIAGIFMISFGSGGAVGALYGDVIGTKEERAVKILDEGSRAYGKLVKSIQKSNNKLSEEQILATVEKGFNSGDFCARDEFMTKRQIKEYILFKNP